MTFAMPTCRYLSWNLGTALSLAGLALPGDAEFLEFGGLRDDCLRFPQQFRSILGGKGFDLLNKFCLLLLI
jgi:hypothetical protein